jgi:tight adherence protein B
MAALISFAFGAGLWLALSTLPARPQGRRRRAPRRAAARVWPAFFDDVASGLRAGLGVGQAVWQAGGRLPLLERAAFAAAEESWRQGRGLTASLADLAAALSVPALTAFVELIQLALVHGGNRLPALLVELAEQTRSQLALVDEVKGRQASTVNAARVAVAAPWVVLALTMTRPDVRQVYASISGLAVLALIAALSLGSYLLMSKLARIEALEVW